MSEEVGVINSSSADAPLAKQAPVKKWKPRYLRTWEGVLSGFRQGQTAFIIKVAGYRSVTSRETLAADWPDILQIERLISMGHMNNKEYIGKANYMVFRTFTQHDFLGKLKEKKLCAVVHLPSQTLLLSVADVPERLIGMLLPGVVVDLAVEGQSEGLFRNVCACVHEANDVSLSDCSSTEGIGNTGTEDLNSMFS